MEPMQFWAKLVKNQHDIRLRLSEAGGILMLLSLGLMGVLHRMGNSGELALVGIVAGLCLVRGGRTFLFEQVIDRQAFEEAKRREGYE